MIGREMLGSGMPSSFASGVAGFGLTVAAAGSTQSDAALVQTSMAIVTGADGTKGVVLLGGVEGDEVWIVNNSASTLKVYPPTGASISVPGTGLGSTNAAFLLTGNATFHGKFESTTQVIASSTVSYAEDAWTPTLTFAVPGDLSVVYTTRVGTYTKVGREVTVSFSVTTSTFTWTTASGILIISGLPFAANSTSGYQAFGAALWQGITKASYTNVYAVILGGESRILLDISGSGQSAQLVKAADMPTGGSVVLGATLTYIV